MGWGRTLFLGDIGNRMDIADSEEEIRRIQRGLSGSFSQDQSQDAKLESLAQENAELKLYPASVIPMLSQRNIISSRTNYKPWWPRLMPKMERSTGGLAVICFEFSQSTRCWSGVEVLPNIESYGMTSFGSLRGGSALLKPDERSNRLNAFGADA